MRISGLETGQSDQVDVMGYLFGNNGLFDTRHLQSVPDILLDGLPRKQSEMLEDHGNARQWFGHVHAIDTNRALVNRQ